MHDLISQSERLASMIEAKLIEISHPAFFNQIG